LAWYRSVGIEEPIAQALKPIIILSTILYDPLGFSAIMYGPPSSSVSALYTWMLGIKLA